MAAGLVLDATVAINATTPTAAEIVATIDSTIAKSGFVLSSYVTNVSASIITVVGGTGVTINAGAAIPVNTNHILTVVLDDVTAGAEAVTVQISG